MRKAQWRGPKARRTNSAIPSAAYFPNFTAMVRKNAPTATMMTMPI